MRLARTTAMRVTAMLALLMPGMAQAAPPAAPLPGDLSPRPLESGWLEALRWQARPVVILGDGAQVEAQIAALISAAQALRERDVVLLTEGPGAAPLRSAQGGAAQGGGFAVLLLGKDGRVKLARRAPVDPSVIIALIDSMPMRQREAAP